MHAGWRNWFESYICCRAAVLKGGPRNSRGSLLGTLLDSTPSTGQCLSVGLGAGAVTCFPGDVGVTQAESPLVKRPISHQPPACKACVTAPDSGYWIHFDLQPSFTTSSVGQNEILWTFNIWKAVQPLHGKSLQSCLTLCNPVDHRNPPGSSVHGSLQARTLQRIAMPSSRGSSWPRDWTLVSYVSCIGRWVLYH